MRNCQSTKSKTGANSRKGGNREYEWLNELNSKKDKKQKEILSPTQHTVSTPSGLTHFKRVNSKFYEVSEHDNPSYLKVRALSSLSQDGAVL